MPGSEPALGQRPEGPGMTELEIAGAAPDDAVEHRGDLPFGAAEALRVLRGDIEGDVEGLTSAFRPHAEPPVASARKRQDRLRPRLAGKPQAAAAQRKR